MSILNAMKTMITPVKSEEPLSQGSSVRAGLANLATLGFGPESRWDSDFGPSDFFRISAFGFRIFISRLTPHASRLTGLCALALLLAATPTHAALTFSWNSGFANAGVVPDGNVTGWSDTRVLSGIPQNSILDVDVTLELTGGWNGDLYGYLTHSSGLSVLLNRVGRTSGDAFGYAEAGLNVRLDDTAANDIHLYQVVLGYATAIADGSAWAPDGRNVSPLTALNTDPRTALLSSFNGLDPNGSWTLFLADLSNGDASKVEEWGLEITTPTAMVPEPGNLIAGFLLAGLFGGTELLRFLRRRGANRA